jgi:hypothetical protein
MKDAQIEKQAERSNSVVSPFLVGAKTFIGTHRYASKSAATRCLISYLYSVDS